MKFILRDYGPRYGRKHDDVRAYAVLVDVVLQA